MKKLLSFVKFGLIVLLVIVLVQAIIPNIVFGALPPTSLPAVSLPPPDNPPPPPPCCYNPDGSFNKEEWCKKDGAGSTCCGAGGWGASCPEPCQISNYCVKEKCVRGERFCVHYQYQFSHAHGCDWADPKIDWDDYWLLHGSPTAKGECSYSFNGIINCFTEAMWRLQGCPHWHRGNCLPSTFVMRDNSPCISGPNTNCFNFIQSIPYIHGSRTCNTDFDCKIVTTTTTKGRTECKTGETTPHYRCDNVDSYDYNKGTYTGVYCVKKDWCGVTNCSISDNKVTTMGMFIRGVFFKDGKKYYNDKCKTCPVGETNPHNKCSKKTVFYKEGSNTWAPTLKYEYDTCETLKSCGVDQCDPSKNVVKRLGAYQDCGETSGCHTAYKQTVYESAECKIGTTTTTTATTTKPIDPVDRYVCNPNSIKVDGYGQCILDNANKHPGAKACDNKNNKVKIIPTECKLKSQYNQTCVAYLTYNTDCTDAKVTTTTKAPPKIQNACRISTFGFYYKKDNSWVEALPLFSKPPEGILDNPKLEYVALECETCELTIEPSIPNFISKNPNIFGKLKGELIKGFSNRYNFIRSYSNNEAIILDVNELTPGSYTLTLDCTDPVLKEHQIKSIKLNIFPQLRWREVVPVIN